MEERHTQRYTRSAVHGKMDNFCVYLGQCSFVEKLINVYRTNFKCLCRFFAVTYTREVQWTPSKGWCYFSVTFGIKLYCHTRMHRGKDRGRLSLSDGFRCQSSGADKVLWLRAHALKRLNMANLGLACNSYFPDTVYNVASTRQ